MNNTEISMDFEILIQEINDISKVLNDELYNSENSNYYIDILDALEYIAEKLRNFILGK
jgi:hypothetical protein